MLCSFRTLLTTILEIEVSFSLETSSAIFSSEFPS
nr:MAG TPA: hypothetical protein [Caudoviricetes sp.]